MACGAGVPPPAGVSALLAARRRTVTLVYPLFAPAVAAADFAVRAREPNEDRGGGQGIAVGSTAPCGFHPWRRGTRTAGCRCPAACAPEPLRGRHGVPVRSPLPRPASHFPGNRGIRELGSAAQCSFGNLACRLVGVRSLFSGGTCSDHQLLASKLRSRGRLCVRDAGAGGSNPLAPTSPGSPDPRRTDGLRGFFLGAAPGRPALG